MHYGSDDQCRLGLERLWIQSPYLQSNPMVMSSQVRHYEALLAEKGVTGVTKVMALRELKVQSSLGCVFLTHRPLIL